MARSMLLIVACLMAFAASSSHIQAQSKNETPTPAEPKDLLGDPIPAGAIARIGTTRYRLPPETRGWTLSPDGSLLAFSNAEEIEIWELPAWKRIQVIKARNINLARPPQFESLTFSSDSKILAAVDVNLRNVHLLDVGAGKSVKRFLLKTKGSIDLPFLKLVGQSPLVVCVSSSQQNGERRVQTWDASQDKLIQSFVMVGDNSHGQMPCIVSDDGRWIATCSIIPTPGGNRSRGAACNLEIWNLATGKIAHKVATELPLYVMAFSPDGKWIAAATDSFLRIYEAETGKEKHNIRLKSPQLIYLRFSPDSKSLYVADSAGKLDKWDPISCEHIVTYSTPAPAETQLLKLAFRPDGKIFGLGLLSNALHFWEVGVGKLYSPTRFPTGSINEMTFTPQGDMFIASDGVLAFWNPRTGDKRNDIQIPVIPTDETYISEGPGIAMRSRIRRLYDIGLSESGDVLAGGGKFYDVKTGKLLYINESSENSENIYTFFERGAKVAGVVTKKVRIWNARTGRDTTSFDLPLHLQETVIGLNASPDGKHFAAVALLPGGDANQSRMLLWDAEKQSLLREFPVTQSWARSIFSPDGKWLVVNEGNRIFLHRFAAKGGQELALARGAEISQIAISFDGRQLAVAAATANLIGSVSRRIFVYEFASKRIRLELAGHSRNASVRSLAFSHDDALLASGSDDTTALVWKAGLRGFAAKTEVAAKDAASDELAEWYKQFAGADAKAAFQKMVLLAQRPSQTVKLLGDKIPPAQKPDIGGKTVRQWIDLLGDSHFVTRSKAMEMLQKIGASTEPDLRAVLTTVKDVEVRRRIEELLDRLADRPFNADEILYSRAVELLEAIDTPDARALLARWTTGEPTSVLTTEARIALARLRK